MDSLKANCKPAHALLAAEIEDGAFEGFAEALGILPPEMLRDPDTWLGLSDTESLHAGCGHLARVPLLTERWD